MGGEEDSKRCDERLDRVVQILGDVNNSYRFPIGSDGTDNGVFVEEKVG